MVCPCFGFVSRLDPDLIVSMDPDPDWESIQIQIQRDKNNPLKVKVFHGFFLLFPLWRTRGSSGSLNPLKPRKKYLAILIKKDLDYPIFSVFKYLDPDPGSESGYASLTAHIQEADWERRSQEQVLVNRMLDMATSVGGASAAITFSFLPSQYQEKRQHLLFLGYH
jgi:hypothetical protein